MKITIKLFCVLIALLFCLTACSAQTSAQTTASDDDHSEPIALTADAFSAMHLSVNDADIYNKEVIIRQPSSEKFTDSQAELQKMEILRGKETSVNYKESFRGAYGDLFSQYLSEEGNLEIIYLNQTNKIKQITANRD